MHYYVYSGNLLDIDLQSEEQLQSNSIKPETQETTPFS